MKLFQKIIKKYTKKTFQEKIIFSIQIILIIYMVPLLVTVFLRYEEVDMPSALNLYLVLYFFLLLSLNKNFSIKFKAIILSTIVYIAAISVFLINGFLSIGQLFFAMASFISVIIINMKYGIILHILSAIFQVIVCILVMNGLYSFSNPLYNDLLSPQKISTLISGYTILVGIIIYYVGKKYEETRYLAENELNKQLNILNTLQDSIPGLFFLYTMEGKLVKWNKQHEIISGYTNQELSRTTIDDWFDKGDDLDKVLSAIEKMQTEDIVYVEVSLKIKNTKKIPFLLTGKKIIIENRDHFLGIGIDISERKLIEEELRQSQKMETVGTLAGGLAHDFNNVLGGIIGAISMIDNKLEQKGSIGTEDLQKYTNIIKNSSSRAVDMVRQLLTISRKQEISFSLVDLNKIIDNVIKIGKNTFDKSIKIVFKEPEKPSIIKADLTQIEQVLLNFCVNASHAMTIMREEEDKWGGTLSIGIEQISANKFFCNNHPEAREIDYWCLSVQDTGVGMSREIMNKIFNPFFTTKDVGSGTGLGLSMVFNIVKQHDGFIDVYSEVRLGSAFNIYLPVLKKSSVVVKNDTKKNIPRGEGLILVVDDEEVLRVLAQEILEECGYKTVIAVNGIEGIKIFEERYSEIKAVLLDMAMPEMAGKETYMKMKDIYPYVKVLLSSGFKQDGRVGDLLELGVNDFIQKPYTLESLSQAIQKTLSG